MRIYIGPRHGLLGLSRVDAYCDLVWLLVDLSPGYCSGHTLYR